MLEPNALRVTLDKDRYFPGQTVNAQVELELTGEHIVNKLHWRCYVSLYTIVPGIPLVTPFGAGHGPGTIASRWYKDPFDPSPPRRKRPPPGAAPKREPANRYWGYKAGRGRVPQWRPISRIIKEGRGVLIEDRRMEEAIWEYSVPFRLTSHDPHILHRKGIDLNARVEVMADIDNALDRKVSIRIPTFGWKQDLPDDTDE